MTTRTAESVRADLLAGIAVAERHLDAAGVATAVLEGGEGRPLVLLHGPGESAAKWLRVLPALLERYRVIAPDLPAHGSSAVPDGPMGEERIVAWLEEVIAECCQESPALVGHVLGGAIGARFAIARPGALGALVLVDSLGLARFRPAALFAATMFGFLARPRRGSYERFMRQCSYDLDDLRDGMGERWEPFVDYNLEMAQSPAAKAAGRMMRELGTPRIPTEGLAGIAVPTSLIWGREDRANRLRVAEAASERYGWPLHPIDGCADDPARDRPERFVSALDSALAPV
jgi:pimeloyl-ACP methyl ester carboxylesterase